MTIFYSATARGFFSANIHADIPDDALPVSYEEYSELLEGQSNGKEIVPGDGGKPALIDPLPPSEEVLAEGARRRRDELLAEAALRIAPLQDAVDLGEATDGEQAALAAWKQYRVALNRIEQQDGFPANINWPSAPEGQ